MSEYHGQKLEKGKEPEGVPAIPPDYRPKAGSKVAELRQVALEGVKQASINLDTIAGPGGATAYAHVRMTGNYGFPGCPNAQSLDYYGITSDEAHKYAWSAFGACGHTIVYFDQNGNVVAQE